MAGSEKLRSPRQNKTSGRSVEACSSVQPRFPSVKMIARCNVIFLLAILLFGFAQTASLVAAFGDPRGFLTNETVTEKTLHPGVKLYRADGFEGGAPQVTHVVSVDLSVPNLSLKSLTGERFVGSTQYFRRSFPSQLQVDNEALVAINTSFFDIGSTQTPSGLIVQDGILIREPQSSRNLLAFDTGRKMTVLNLGMTGAVVHNGQSHSFVGMNRNAIANGQIVVYQQPWNRSPGNSSPFTDGLAITEVVLRKGTFLQSTRSNVPSRLFAEVLSIRNNQGPVTIGGDQFVLTAAGNARSFLQAMQPGNTLEVRWTLTGGPPSFDWSSATQIVAGSNRLITNGVRNSGNTAHWNNRHPRSAAGISADGTQLILLQVEGRQAGRAEGMSLHAIARYLQHMGAIQAVEFDGGGSSGLAARVDGLNQLVSTPSDGGERYVPAGLGIIAESEDPHPFFGNIRITPGAGAAVVSWTTLAPAVSHVIFGSHTYDRQSRPPPRPATRHSALLTGLEKVGTTFLRLVAETPGSGTLTSHGLEVTLGTLTMDDSEAAYTGSWLTGAYPSPWGPDYHHAVTVTGAASHTATFYPDITTSGNYDIYVWFVHGGNRPPDAQYRIRHDGGITSRTLNQTSGGSQWRLLASNLAFTAGEERYIQILNTSSIAGRHVMVDGLRMDLQQPAPTPAETPPLWWTKHYFDSKIPDPSVDNDGDGVSLWEEYLWATDPTSPGSRPEVELRAAESGAWMLSFSPFHEGRSYQVLARESLTEESGWTSVRLADPILAEDGRGVFTISSNLPYRFFRLEVSEP